jgi:hypothetical protein
MVVLVYRPNATPLTLTEAQHLGIATLLGRL